MTNVLDILNMTDITDIIDITDITDITDIIDIIDIIDKFVLTDQLVKTYITINTLSGIFATVNPVFLAIYIPVKIFRQAAEKVSAKIRCSHFDQVSGRVVEAQYLLPPAVCCQQIQIMNGWI